PGGGPRDRARFRQDADLHARGRIDSGRVDVPGGARPPVGAVRRRPARRERARAERKAGRVELPQRHHRVGDAVRRDRARRRHRVSRLESIVARLEAFYGVLPSPPSNPFTLFVWEVLSTHSNPRKRDAALAALKRIRALTPDAMWRAPQ